MLTWKTAERNKSDKTATSDEWCAAGEKFSDEWCAAIEKSFW